MTTPVDPPELPDEELDALASLLGSAAVWDDPALGVEDALVAEIADEIGARPHAPAPPGRSDRRHLRVLGAAAALFLIAGIGIALLFAGEDDGVTVVALSGTDLAPGATADAELEDLASGLRVVLDVSDLPPAEPGTYYQGWVRTEDGDAVTIGTFHMRGGDAEIELWAGVSSVDYPILTVTIQEEGAGAESSGMVVLRGRLDAEGDAIGFGPTVELTYFPFEARTEPARPGELVRIGDPVGECQPATADSGLWYRSVDDGWQLSHIGQERRIDIESFAWPAACWGAGPFDLRIPPDVAWSPVASCTIDDACVLIEVDLS